MSIAYTDEPYGDFLPYDRACPRVIELKADLGRDLTAHEAERHRAICERCMMLAVLSSELLPEESDELTRVRGGTGDSASRQGRGQSPARDGGAEAGVVPDAREEGRR